MGGHRARDPLASRRAHERAVRRARRRRAAGEDGARAALEALGIPDGDRVRRYSEAKQVLVAKLIEQDAFRPFDDGVGLLLRLKEQGLRVAAASSSRNAGELLARVRVAEVCRRRGESYPFVADATSVADLLDADLSGRRFEHGKPDPAIFLAAARELGVDPSEALVVEDAPSGVEAARRGGMRSVGVNRADDADDLRAHGATWVVDSLDDATGLLVTSSLARRTNTRVGGVTSTCWQTAEGLAGRDRSSPVRRYWSVQAAGRRRW